jgi:hypothetical protein
LRATPHQAARDRPALGSLEGKQLGYIREVAASGGKPDGQRAAAHLRRRHAVEAANASVTAWIEKRTAFAEQDASGKDDADVARLEARADEVEGYAVAVFELAVAAADEQPRRLWRRFWPAMMPMSRVAGRTKFRGRGRYRLRVRSVLFLPTEEEQRPDLLIQKVHMSIMQIKSLII